MAQNPLEHYCLNIESLARFQNLEKVQRFEEFVDRRLKPDLVCAIAERDKVFEKQKVFSDLRKNIENLEKNSVTSLRALVNLGSEVYMQADILDFGFHVEFTWSEALNYITAREEKLASVMTGTQDAWVKIWDLHQSRIWTRGRCLDP
ncbi:hypothetical protein ACSBR2_023857 [Camellia fascicularis]